MGYRCDTGVACGLHTGQDCWGHFPDGVITGAVNDVVDGKSCESAARDAKLHPDLSSEATRPIYGVAVDKIRAGCD